MRLLSLLSLSSLISSVLSLSASQAASDWEKTHIGVPHVNSPVLSPTFHRLQLQDGKASVFLLTATTSNVLGAVDPVGGSVVWRHINNEDDPILAYQARQDGIVMLSGPGAANVRLLEVKTGNIIWEALLHKPKEAYLLEPQTLGVGAAFAADSSPDIFVLANGHSVHRLNGLSGASKWKWSAPDQTSSILYSQIVVTKSGIFVVGFVKSLQSYTLHITSLDVETGAEIASQSVPSSIVDASKNVLLLNDDKQFPQPRLVWTENGNLKAVALTPELKLHTPSVTAGIHNIVDVQLNSFGMFIGLTPNKTASVFALSDTKEGIKKIWELSESFTAPTRSESTFGGGLDKAGKPYVSRVYWSTKHGACNMEIFAPHEAQGQGAVVGSTFHFNTVKHGVVIGTAIEVAHLSELRYIARFAVTTSTGSFSVWQQDRQLWLREESLANIEAAAVVDLPQPLIKGDPRAASASEGFRKRIDRQIGDLQYLPGYLAHFAKRFTYGSSATAPAADLGPIPMRDAFGFRKFIIAATAYGTVMAIDSTNGEVKWSQLLSISETTGMPMNVKMKMLVANAAEDLGKTPEVYLAVTHLTTKGEQTSLYHFDALNGFSLGLKRSQGFAAPQYEIDGPFLEALLVQGSENAVALVDEKLNAHVYPSLAVDPFKKAASKLHLSLVTGIPGARRLAGYQVSTVPTTKRNIFPLYRTWGTSFGGEYDVQTLVKPATGPVASYGKVLGDRTTLYKYLNPHAVAVVTASRLASTPGMLECGVSVIDGVKGTVLFHAPLHTTRSVCDVEAALVDNWLVYYHYEDLLGDAKGAKGHRITTVELFEGSKADDKTGSSEISSQSHDQSKLTVYQQTFVFAHAIKRMAATSTKFGIALKDIIVATEKHQVQALPRRLLDPRRPKGKPTSAEQEEGLIPFDPVFTDDARRVLSHTYQIARVKEILTSPSQLESTSLVFSYGLDLFQTRVSPSSTFDLLSEDFNRFQLVVTIAGLVAAILVTRPLVRSNALKRQWY